MTSIDLPVDIWLEILSYLPRWALFKTCTLNGAIFELSLDYLYEEILLSDSDKEIEETFRKLIRDHRVARRVRRLHICSSPSRLNDQLPSLRTSPARLKKYNTRLMYLEDLSRDFAKVPRVKVSNAKFLQVGVNCFDDAIDSTTKSRHITTLGDSGAHKLRNLESDAPLAGLANLLHFSVALSDRNMNLETLGPFLHLLWKSGCISPNLQKLEFESSVFDMPILFSPAIRYCNINSSQNAGRTSTGPSGVLRNLTHLSIAVAASPKASFNTNNLISSSLRRLLTAFAQPAVSARLTMLSLTSSTFNIDHSALLDAIPHLPDLTQLKLHIPFLAYTIPDRSGVTRFLGSYKEQLTNLNLFPSEVPRWLMLDDDSSDEFSSDSDEESDEGDLNDSGWRSRGSLSSRLWCDWVLHRELSTPAIPPSPSEGDDKSNKPASSHHAAMGFPSLSFPALRRLVIRGSDWTQNGVPRPFALGSASDDASLRFPSFREITPNITSLSILEISLLDEELDRLIAVLPASSDGECLLESLSVSLQTLRPANLELFHDFLPRLKSLNIVYSALGQSLADREHGINQFPTMRSKDLFLARLQQSSATEHEETRYPRWTRQLNWLSIRSPSLNLATIGTAVPTVAPAGSALGSAHPTRAVRTLCKIPHPDMDLMTSITRCVSASGSRIVLDDEKKCACLT